MPVVMILRNVSDSDLSPQYQPPTFLNPDPERLREIRADHARMRDELLGYQKAAGKAGDMDTARFFKDEANWHLKRWRAADHWHRWIAGEGGRSPLTWPCELANHFDFVQAQAA